MAVHVQWSCVDVFLVGIRRECKVRRTQPYLTLTLTLTLALTLTLTITITITGTLHTGEYGALVIYGHFDGLFKVT